MLAPASRLNTWKEIAAHLKRGVRTVQRWERDEGLPVHRLAHQKLGSVYAYPGELDEWWKKRGSELADNQPAKPRRPVLRWAAAAAATTLIATANWRASVPGPEGAARIVPLTSFRGTESSPSFSPDGESIVFSWDGETESNTDIYTMRVGGSAPKRLTTDPAADLFPVWSPDGAWIAFLRESSGKVSVLVIPASGGAERKIGDAVYPLDLPAPALAWRRDSQSLILADRSPSGGMYALFEIAFDGTRRQLTDPPSGSIGDGGPAVSPDGKIVAFVRRPSFGTGEIFLLQNGKTRQLTSGGHPLNGLMWGPAGDRLYFLSSANDRRGIFRMPIRGGTPEQVEPGAPRATAAAISARGDRMAFSEGRYDVDIWRLDLEHATPQRFISSTWPDQTPQFSPDGSRIAFASARSGVQQIWICGRDGSNARQLTTLSGLAGTPRWSPDGTTIVFDGRVNGNQDIYMIPAAGGAPRRLTEHQAIDGMASWSRDGRWIYFASNRSGDFQVWKMPSSGGEAIRVTRQGGYGAFESADGTTVYYAKGHGATSLWQVPTSGGQERELLPSLSTRHNFTVTPAGIYYSPIPGDREGESIRFYSFATRQTRRVAVFDRPLSLGLSVAPDGKSLLYVAGERGGGDLMLIENVRW